jgi:hypothetical protein
MKSFILNHPRSILLGGLMLFVSSLGWAQSTSDIAEKSTAIRVIDNKGTIKYLQSDNGITTLTNTTSDVTTTTWQLGGTLIADTSIDVSTFEFGLLNLGDVSDMTDSDPAATYSTGSGYTLLVIDESTGDIKRLLATSLIQNGHERIVATAGQTAFPLTGSPSLPTFEQVWVFRNGAKLIAGLDYTISGSTVTLVPSTTSPNDWTVLADDVIEVQFIK